MTALTGKALLDRVRERYTTMFEADQENRKLAVADLEFLHVPGKQWDTYVKTERGARPCYEFNKTRITVKRVVNDIRANRPQGKVRAVEDGDVDTAEVMEGLCRNTWNVSDGDTIIDAAAEFQVGCGYAAWRVNTRYTDDEVSNQEIRIEAIRNPFCLHSDPAAQDYLKRDAEDWILTERITKAAFEAKYPDQAKDNFEGSELDDRDDAQDWCDGERVRIAEYWWKEPYTRELWLLSDGKTIDSTEVDPDLGRAVTEQDLASIGLTVVKRRDVRAHRIKMAIVSGAAVLEGPTDWAGKEFPFIQIYGESVVIEGKVHWFGLTRFAKDAQRSYNIARTSISETIALTPQAKFWATAKQAEGHLPAWAVAHKENMPFGLYNSDPAAPGPPQRMGGADVPVALIQESQLASDEIKAVTGIFDASLGNRSNEQSGIAIRARQNQGEIATFNYADNLAKGIRRTWEILVDLYPKIVDTERSMRILGADGAEKYVKVNSVDPETGLALNDLSRGKFDVSVSTGPGYATQRQEAAETYTAMIQANPALFPIIGDLVLKASDLPYAEQMAERVKAMAPPQIQALDNDGKKLPPEVMQAMQQVDQMQQQVQQHGQLVQQANAELEGEKADNTKAKAEIQVAIANLKVQEANLAVDVANFKTLVAETQSQMAEAQNADATAGMQQREQQMTDAASRQGETTAAQIVEQAIGGVSERLDKLERSLAERLMSMTQQPPIIISGGGGGRKVVNFTRDASGRPVGATVDEVSDA